MTDEDFVELERKHDDLRTQLIRLKACVERMQKEASRASQDCCDIEEALCETQALLDRISAG